MYTKSTSIYIHIASDNIYIHYHHLRRLVVVIISIHGKQGKKRKGGGEGRISRFIRIDTRLVMQMGRNMEQWGHGQMLLAGMWLE